MRSCARETDGLKRRLAAFAACAFVLVCTACAKPVAGVLKVGAAREPHARILNVIRDDIKKDGIELEIFIADDTQLNEALEEGRIDANYFQHVPFMEQVNSYRGFHLVSAGTIHIEPIGLYSNKITNIGQLEDGAVIAIPNDRTNKVRALRLLDAAGLIRLKRGAEYEAVLPVIAENKRHIRFLDANAADLPGTLGEVDAAIIDGNYALSAGLNARHDGIVVEDASSPYANVVAVKRGNEKDPRIKALVAALQSQKVRGYIFEHYPNGEVIPAF
jgi:D-methionine transport system substrate-binding protein